MAIESDVVHIVTSTVGPFISTARPSVMKD